ncbi:unnamed protein product [Dovyalis caffra]|uniref:Uncharacterized protein n=1 Tax=Dovyalis caffra TaxID=77055 RepID=A0AAV1SI89_9ROSI|nr:unnamed protein product [Dovyalis caffra]
MVKAALVDKNGLRKGAWSEEEDTKLRVYVQKFGHWNWRQLPKFAGLSRCGKSCRLRWMNYLRPDVKRGNFSEEEDNLIIQMHEELGNKWCVIAGKLPGRTDNEIKNHWHTNLSKRVKQNQSVSSELMNKEKSTETSQTSQSEVSETEKSETESVSVNTPSESGHRPKTVENFPSSHEISCIEFSSMSNDSMSGVNGVAEECFSSSMEIFQDFWNQPFLADNNCNQDGYDSMFLTEEGLMSSYASNYGDDGIDWIQQAMQEIEDSTS